MQSGLRSRGATQPVPAGGAVRWVNMGDERVRDVPLAECREPLVDMRAMLRVEDRRRLGDGSYAYVRAGLRERLMHANRQLPDGVHLLLVEGHRMLSVQLRIFREYAADVAAANPRASSAEVYSLTCRYVAPAEVAGHVAGAAVDVTLSDDGGNELDMGCPEGATPEQSNGRCFTEAADISPAARNHRAQLLSALSAAGLVNYPAEWWHFSYGDRYWALMTEAPSARYAQATETVGNRSTRQ